MASVTRPSAPLHRSLIGSSEVFSVPAGAGVSAAHKEFAGEQDSLICSAWSGTDPRSWTVCSFNMGWKNSISSYNMLLTVAKSSLVSFNAMSNSWSNCCSDMGSSFASRNGFTKSHSMAVQTSARLLGLNTSSILNNSTASGSKRANTWSKMPFCPHLCAEAMQYLWASGFPMPCTSSGVGAPKVCRIRSIWCFASLPFQSGSPSNISAKVQPTLHISISLPYI
mmetsp:Transcript_56920/g.94440  ORF Transcript_56920/g.94440 Transcript_56920/m.94440 type:complete len:224 (-) Transcript_56920:651-1322(-)